MRRIFEIAVVTAAVAFALPGIGAREAKAEPNPSAVTTPAPSDVKSKTRHPVARAPRRTSPKSAAASTTIAPQQVFLSDAWLKQEKVTDDKLKRFMNICKGC
jgi:hypothetical protein